MSAPPPGFDPETADNNQDVERQWAVKSIQHMLTYWKILESMPGSKLKLTKYDDDIYSSFQKHFPDFDAKARINEDEMKSGEGKEKWRNFIKLWEDKIEDFNFGTMLRADAAKEYDEKDTIFAVRMQFYAIEIVRNRLGLNDWVWEQEHPEEAKKAKEETKAEAS